MQLLCSSVLGGMEAWGDIGGLPPCPSSQGLSFISLLPGSASPWLSHYCSKGFHLFEARGLSKPGLRPVISLGFSAPSFLNVIKNREIPLTSHVSVFLVSAGTTSRSTCGGEWIYLSYAELFHLPTCWMSHMGSPTVAASVTALIPRLWLLY